MKPEAALPIMLAATMKAVSNPAELAEASPLLVEHQGQEADEREEITGIGQEAAGEQQRTRPQAP